MVSSGHSKTARKAIQRSNVGVVTWKTHGTLSYRFISAIDKKNIKAVYNLMIQAFDARSVSVMHVRSTYGTGLFTNIMEISKMKRALFWDLLNRDSRVNQTNTSGNGPHALNEAKESISKTSRSCRNVKYLETLLFFSPFLRYHQSFHDVMETQQNPIFFPLLDENRFFFFIHVICNLSVVG